MLKRNFNYNVGNIDYNLDGTRLVCKVAGTTGIDPLRIPSGATEVVDGTVTWKLVDYAGIDYSLDEKKIGTYLDEKPLYQRVFKGWDDKKATMYTIDTELNTTNYKIVSIWGHCKDTNSYNFPYADQTYTVGCYISNSGTITVRAGSAIQIEYIVVWYTKVGDIN